MGSGLSKSLSPSNWPINTYNYPIYYSLNYWDEWQALYSNFRWEERGSSNHNVFCWGNISNDSFHSYSACSPIRTRQKNPWCLNNQSGILLERTETFLGILREQLERGAITPWWGSELVGAEEATPVGLSFQSDRVQTGLGFCGKLSSTGLYLKLSEKANHYFSSSDRGERNTSSSTRVDQGPLDNQWSEISNLPWKTQSLNELPKWVEIKWIDSQCYQVLGPDPGWQRACHARFTEQIILALDRWKR